MEIVLYLLDQIQISEFPGDGEFRGWKLLPVKFEFFLELAKIDALVDGRGTGLQLRWHHRLDGNSFADRENLAALNVMEFSGWLRLLLWSRFFVETFGVVEFLCEIEVVDRLLNRKLRTVSQKLERLIPAIFGNHFN